MKKSTAINVQWVAIGIVETNQESYISLTDIARYKNSLHTGLVISHWLSSKYTVEFTGIWEKLHNPNFNITEFSNIKNNSWSNWFVLSVSQRKEKTNAIGIFSKAWRYWSWTYAHKDIAFEFGSWISPRFKIYLIKEFQRLKEQEQKSLGWSISREIAKINYKIHTDAIKDNLIHKKLSQDEINYIYADEADLLNKVLFGQTAKQRKDQNIQKEGNIRTYATIEQLIVLSTLESINALLINNKLPQYKRIQELSKTAISQMKSLIQNQNLENINKLSS